jgi:hypothetical protein
MIYYVALPFTPEDGGGLAPGQAIECPSGAAAIRRAEAIARHVANAGAVAFSPGAAILTLANSRTP